MEHIGSLLLGLGSGGVFAALALALVITYRSSGVINFATGAIALYVAYTYAALRRGEFLVVVPGLPSSIDIGRPLGFVPAAAVALLVAAFLGAGLYLIVFRPLRDAPPMARAVASLGVLVAMEGLLALQLGTAPVAVRPIFPNDSWQIGPVMVQADRFYLAITVVVLTLFLAAVYKYTRFGLTTRAAAESTVGAFVSGVSPDRVALLNWMISAMVAGAAGILIAPLSPLTPVTYTMFVVPALAAAVVGRFQYLVPAVLAGLAIGMIQAEATVLAQSYTWLPQTGLSELVPLVIVVVALVVVGAGMPSRGGLVRHPLGHAPKPRSLMAPTLIGSAAGVLALMATDGTWRAAVIGTFIAAVIALSLVVVTGYAGQVSVAQLALAGAAAFSLSVLTEDWNIPFPVAPLLAAAVASVVGVVVGLPALRLRGLSLGVVTLAFAYAIEAVWFRNTGIVSTEGARVRQPSLLGLDLGVGTGHDFPRMAFGLLCLATLVAVAWGVARLRMSHLGSAMLAVRANERSAAGVGVDVTRIKVLSFALASFIAGLGGALLAYRRGVVTFDSFTVIEGLALLSTAYLAGVTSVWGGICAGLLAGYGIIFIALDRWTEMGDWFPVVSGVALVLTLIFHPEGIATLGHQLADRLARLRGRDRDGPVALGKCGGENEPWAGASVESVALEVTDLTVRYGGVVAVSGVSFCIGPGTVVGLIGPNGAGKTSVIDGVTGFTRAYGDVRLGGRPLEGLPPHARARAGLGRTFQSLDLYDDLSVEENVSVAAFGASRRNRHDSVTRALERVGISALRYRPAGQLSQGERQLVSIARSCVAGPKVLLLDEPAAGLDTLETVGLGERIREISRAGTGVLLVDHDVSLVLAVCDDVIVLDFGEVIAQGTPDEVRSNPVVAKAYLGGAFQGAQEASS